MKTAMQELLDTLENDWSSPQPYIDLVKSKLEKEKEQIIDSYYGNIDGVYGYREAGKEYYNQTYNK
jgi:hypothetical protein